MKRKLTQFVTYLLSIGLLAGFATKSAIADHKTAKKPVFDIQSKIFIDGELISSPRVVTRANQKATINFSDQEKNKYLKMILIAQDESKIGKKIPIKIEFDVEDKNCHATIHSKPSMVVFPNQLGVVKFKSESGHNYEMRVIASRIS